MPRKGEVKRRDVLPDPKFHDRMVTKFIDQHDERRQEELAERIFYGALDLVARAHEGRPLGVFKRALDNVKPLGRGALARVGGATYQVPGRGRPRAPHRRSACAGSCSTRARGREVDGASGSPASSSTPRNGRGGAIKKKEDTHRMAEANKAFAHYRW